MIVALSSNIRSRFKIYAELSKFRLTSFVILSSVLGYLFAAIGSSIDWVQLVLFTIGGSMVTFASNSINQLIEKESDKLMKRTMTRPLPESRVSTTEVILFIGVNAVIGITLLTVSINPLTGVLAAISLLLYGFVYTPLKKISSIAVFVGAIPGAMPPLLGYVAVTNSLNQMAVWLFLVQFFWQFVHFWAIAWLSYEDYSKADMYLLPHSGGKTKQSAWIIWMYSLVLIPLGLYPLMIGYTWSIGVVLLVLAGMFFSYQAWTLFRLESDRDARRLMFGSFAYLLVFLVSLFFL